MRVGEWRETHAQAVLDVRFHLGVKFLLSVLPGVGHVLCFNSGKRRKNGREAENG